MKIVIAPDSFKGSLSAVEAAEAIAQGIRLVQPEAELILMPLADGGEGTVEALTTATGGRFMTSAVTGPLSESIDARWGLLGPNSKTAVIEMAAAAGLPLVPLASRDPRRTTTFGVGELILQAARSGANRIIIGLGGSATNDGGAGALQAMGVRFYSAAGDMLPQKLTGGDLTLIAHMDASDLTAELSHVEIEIASDVTNPLLGPSGASAVYGPQKGATKSIIAELEAGLTSYASVIHSDLGRDVSKLPGAGAAGGLGAGLLACLNTNMRSGIDIVLNVAGFDKKAIGADWIFTGEGRIDAQTLNGKTIAGVLSRCQSLGGIPVLAFGGSVDDDAAGILAASGLRAAFPIVSGPMTLNDAMRDGKTLLTQAASRVMRLL